MMKIPQILMFLAIVVLAFTAIDLGRFLNGIRARRLPNSDKADRFAEIGRAHGFPPASDMSQIIKYGSRALAGIACLGLITCLSVTFQG